MAHFLQRSDLMLSTDEAVRQANDAAEKLKAEFEPRLPETPLAKQLGISNASDRAIFRIKYARAEKAKYCLIGNFNFWHVYYEKQTYPNYTGCSLGDWFSKVELYSLFRNTFEPLGAHVSHPSVELRTVKDDKKSLPSERSIVVQEDKPVFLRPIGDLSTSVCTGLEIRIDSNLEGRKYTGPMFGAIVDPLGIPEGASARSGRGAPAKYYSLNDPSWEPNTALSIEVDWKPYLLVATIMAMDAEKGEMTLALDESVETFKPGR
jgi:hypothetical protein